MSMNKSRKTYAKPLIAVEDFTLNQFIAGCTINTKQSDWRQQLMHHDYLMYTAMVRSNHFTGELGCTVHADTITDDMDTLCYHTSTSPLFGS